MITHRNKVELIGEVSLAAVLSYTPNGTAVLKFGLETRKSYQGNTYKTYHTIIAWKNLAENNAGLNQGDTVWVEGEINYRSWDDKNGEKRYATEITVFSITKLDSNAEHKKDQTGNTHKQEEENKSSDGLPF